MADPIVSHDNAGLDGEFPDHPTIHAGFNDSHELTVEGKSLVGLGFTVTGPARKVLVIPPLTFDLNGNLILDLNSIANLTTMQAQIATLQAQVADLQTQVAVLSETTLKLPVLNAVLSGAAGHLTATLSRVDNLTTALTASGALTASLGIPNQISALFAGAGKQIADAGGPKGLGVVNATATGALTVNVITARPLGTAAFTGISNLAGNLAYAYQCFAAFGGNGTLTADVYRSAMLATARFNGTGALTASVLRDAVFVAAAFNGASSLAASTTLNRRISSTFAGAGSAVPNLTLGIGSTTLDPANTVATIFLSGGNLILTSGTGGSTGGSSRGTKSRNSGQLYFEVTVLAGASNTVYAGFCDASFDITRTLGSNTDGWSLAADNHTGPPDYAAYWNGTYNTVGFLKYGTGAQAGDVIMCAADLTNGNMYFGVNGAWVGGSSSPGSPNYSFTPGTTLYPALSIYQIASTAASQLSFNPGSSAFVYTPPTGYSAWG